VNELYTRFDAVFFEKTRLSIVTLLNQEERLAFGALKERLGGTDGAIYTHLEKLIKAGYVRKERELTPTGAQTMYELTDVGATEFRAYIDFLASVVTQTRNTDPHGGTR
jgi:predicted ArsR family transcriptional regulator